MRIIAALLVTMVAAPSFADDGAHELEAALKPVAPSTGLDKAPLRAPPWCGAVRNHDDQWAYNVKEKLNDFHPRTANSRTLLDGVALVCSGATSPIGQRAAQALEQLWINETGLSEADAVVSLTARANIEQFEAERDKLCEKLPEDETDNQSRVFSNSRRALFGCEGSDPLWSNRRNLDELRAWIDRGEVERDGQLRLAWMLHRLYIDLDPTEKITDTLAGYAIDQFDLHLPNDAVMHTLDAEPFRGNRAAKIILMESLANERMNAARLEAAVATKPEWKDILVTAPRKAFDAWNAAAEKRKDVLARSDEVAKKGHHKDSHGDCEAALRADLGPIIKAMKHDTVSTLLDQISEDPLAGLLLARVAKCAKHDEAGEWVENMSEAVRMVRGPRSAAWYAVVDAVAKKGSFRTRTLTDVGVNDERDQPYETELGDQGVIASATKSGKGLKVTFVHQRAVVDNWKCVEGTKVDRIDPDSGRVTYRQVCHADGKITVDSAPNPTVVPLLWAAGIAPGRLMRFRANEHGSMPAEVWADKSQKKLVALYGFPLE
jgi:hypothetical protein